MSKMKSQLAMLSMLGVASVMMGSPVVDKTDWREKYPADPIIPKPPGNSKGYFFNIAGEFSTVRMRKDECVFTCYAINDKNAIRKFNRWRNTQPK